MTVAAYYLLYIVSDRPHEEILPEEGTSFTFKVQNHGNSVDSYELEIINTKELKDAGWSVELSKSSITGVPPKGEMDVSVTVRSPQDWSWDLWISRPTVIVLKATSLGARQSNLAVTYTFPLYAHVEGYNNPVLEMITTIIVLIAVGVTISVIIRRRRKKRSQAPAKEES